MKETKEKHSFRISTLFIVFFAVVFAVSAVFFCASLYRGYRESKALSALSAHLAEERENREGQEAYQLLKEENPDFAGWLSVEGTAIDYPVMLTPNDPEFYLYRDFQKKKAVSGLPFLGKGCDLSGNQLLIHGHSMKNGTMFADVLLYNKKSYWKEHPAFTFDTPEEHREYEIIAAFPEKIHKKEETHVFRYYNYSGTLSEKDFETYVSNIKRLSLYDTGKTAEYGDELISLSTCAYKEKHARFVIVGKRVK